MSGDTVFVFALIGVAGALMASNRVRFDVVALLVLLALLLSDVLTTSQALSGFGSSVVILVAGLLVVGEMLARTGVASAVGDWILARGGTSEMRLLVLIMLGAGVLGAVMSSTAVVAIFIPIVLRVAAETRLDASRMLIPMSYASLISGMLTLIATTPNIVVHEELKGAGYAGFGFFGFTLVGLAVLAVAVVYVLLVGRRLLGGDGAGGDAVSARRSADELLRDFSASVRPYRLRVPARSALAGASIEEGAIESRYGARVLGIERGPSGERLVTPPPSTRIEGGDVLLVVEAEATVQRLVDEERLEVVPASARERQRWLWEMGGAVVLIHPESSLVDKSLREARFRSDHDVQVIGMRRAKAPVEDLAEEKLRVADSLLVVGSWQKIQQLQTHTHDFVVIELPNELDAVVPSYRRMPVALAILGAMVLATILDVVPLGAAVLMAALAAVLTRCLTMEDAYRAIHWPSLVLIAGMLPLADALDATGGTRVIVDALMDLAGDAGPYAMMTLLFVLTAGLGLVLSNTASAVLVAPIAIYAANALGVSPYPFAVAVLIAASAAYSTPVSTPVVTLVVDPGGYRFMDFVKAGVPLLVLTYAATVLVAPLVFPFDP